MAPLVAALIFLCVLTVNGAEKTPLYIGSMSPLTGTSSWWGEGIRSAAEMAFLHVNNRTDVLRDYELRLVANDTQGKAGLGNQVLFDYIYNRKLIMMLGPSRSNVAESVSETAKFWSLLQISASANSLDLSSKSRFPYFTRTISNLPSSNPARLNLIKTFDWRRVATLHYNKGLFSETVAMFAKDLEKAGIELVSSDNFGVDPKIHVEHLKKLDVRIIFGFFYDTRARKVFCEAYKQKLYGPKYVWLLISELGHDWWNQVRADDELDCTKEQLKEAAEGHIMIDYLYISHSNLPTVSGWTPSELDSAYKQHVKATGSQESIFRAYAYDAAWLAALALNRSISALPPGKNLSTFHYGNDVMADLFVECIKNTTFRGMTGGIQIDSNGERWGIFEIYQMNDDELHAIATFEVQSGKLQIEDGKKFLWSDGKIPVDGVTRIEEHLQLSDFTLVCLGVLSGLGVLLSCLFLWFNIYHRHTRFIKLSSPNINNLIIVGCILAYMSAVLFAMTGRLLHNLICKLRVCSLTVGFTLAFGSMFSKTWRVHVITRRMSTVPLRLKDRHLLGVIVCLLLIDICILLIWFLTDPLTTVETTLDEEPYDETEDKVLVSHVTTCSSNHITTWTSIVYVIKGLLLVFGVFLAWETRNVKIAALNDSQHIGMAVYNVVFTCLFCTPTVAVLTGSLNLEATVITASSIILCTTSTICLVFIPKVRGLKMFNPDDVSTMHRGTLPHGGNTKCQCTMLKKEVERLQKVIDERECLEFSNIAPSPRNKVSPLPSSTTNVKVQGFSAPSSSQDQDKDEEQTWS